MKNYTHKDVLRANRQYYDVIGPEYCLNERYAYSSDIVRNVTENLNKMASLLEHKNFFLDFGCGSGFLSELLVKHHLFKHSVGIDISVAQANLFNQKLNNSNHRAAIADIVTLPYRDSTFDMAGCYSVLHHILEYKSAIKEVTRVLKSKGILYIDFEPTSSFRKLMSIPIKLRRLLLDRAPKKLDQLEFIAEYHHNVEKGINAEGFVKWLKNDYEILEIKPRFPESIFQPVLKFLSVFSWSYVPYFYTIARKK
jgi:ubiquinone/menaquinone biosynthesis C-methylase UbiE